MGFFSPVKGFQAFVETLARVSRREGTPTFHTQASIDTTEDE